MKALGKVFLFALLVGCVGVLGIARFCLNQVELLKQNAQREPQQLELASIEQGITGNHHVRLSNFIIGEPVFEKDEKWEGVWLPLFVSHTEPVRAILWAPSVESRERLKQLQACATLDALISKGMPKNSLFRTVPSARLSYAFSEDPEKARAAMEHVVLLRETTYPLPWGKSLDIAILLAPAMQRNIYIAMCAAVLVGALCVVLLLVTDRPVKHRRMSTPSRQQYQVLKTEPQISRHPFSWQLVMVRFAKQFGWFLLSSITTVILLVIADNANEERRPVVAVLMYGGSIILGIASLRILVMSLQTLMQRISQVEVYRSGISWVTGGDTKYALWEDIAEVYRAESHWFRRGNLEDAVSQLTLKFFDGRALTFSADAFLDFDILAEQIQSLHGGWIYAVKTQELMIPGEADFGDQLAVRPDGLVLKKTFYRWGDLEFFVLDNGWLAFQRRRYVLSPRVSIPLSAIPNVRALLALLEDKALLLAQRRKPSAQGNPVMPGIQ